MGTLRVPEGQAVQLTPRTGYPTSTLWPGLPGGQPLPGLQRACRRAPAVLSLPAASGAPRGRSEHGVCSSSGLPSRPRFPISLPPSGLPHPHLHPSFPGAEPWVTSLYLPVGMGHPILLPCLQPEAAPCAISCCVARPQGPGFLFPLPRPPLHIPAGFFLPSALPGMRSPFSLPRPPGSTATGGTLIFELLALYLFSFPEDVWVSLRADLPPTLRFPRPTMDTPPGGRSRLSSAF